MSEKDQRKHVEEVEERLHLAVVALADGPRDALHVDRAAR